MHVSVRITEINFLMSIAVSLYRSKLHINSLSDENCEENFGVPYVQAAILVIVELHLYRVK